MLDGPETYKRDEIQTIVSRLNRILEITRDLPIRHYEQVLGWTYFKCYFNTDDDFKEALRSLVEHDHDIDSCSGGVKKYIIVKNDAK